MSNIGTNTSTFTAVDIRKVVDNFAADFSMMAQSTGLRTRESAAADIEDLKVFAEFKYLISVMVILYDEKGEKVRASTYEVSESATGWKNERPGNSLWPRTPGGRLKVYGTFSNSWHLKTPEEKASFIKSNKLNGSWPLTSDNTSLVSLSSSSGQQYSSKGYGWERTNYTA